MLGFRDPVLDRARRSDVVALVLASSAALLSRSSDSMSRGVT